ncbi:unnamed protein product [Bubo scandiacus]
MPCCCPAYADRLQALSVSAAGSVGRVQARPQRPSDRAPRPPAGGGRCAPGDPQGASPGAAAGGAGGVRDLLRLGGVAAGHVPGSRSSRSTRAACTIAPAPHHFCYTNTRVPQWHDVWTRTQIRVNSSRMIRVTQVGSEEELEEFSVWNVFSFLKEKLNDTSIDVDLYSNKTCLKVELLEAGTTYCVVLFRRFDPKLFLVFFLGLLLFFCGDVLSRSQLFYYSAGISFGLLASLLILVYMMSKVMPRRSPVYILLAGGWSFSLYLLQLIFKNLREICECYWQYLLGYLLLVGFVSFGVCYRYGPLETRRSISLLSWALQLLGLLLMYSGIQIHPIALALVVIAICTKNLDYPLQWAFAAYRRGAERQAGAEPSLPADRGGVPAPGRGGDPQGPRGASKLLQKPRFLCLGLRSPASSLPRGFADFVGGACHVTPNEVSVHERENSLGDIFEDELSEEEEENDSLGGAHTCYPLSHNHLDAD